MTERNYPTVSRTEMDRISSSLLADRQTSTANSIVYQPMDVDVPTELIRATCDLVLEQREALVRKGHDDPDVIEGRLAATLHAGLADLPVQVLGDPGFWRYLSLDLWDLVAWRENLTEKNVRKYVDGTVNAECVPLRMFLRAQASLDGDDYALTYAIPAATDFWRSHVVRVRTGANPSLARALATMQRDDRLATNPLRAFARRLNRLSSNLVLTKIDDVEAAELVRELRASEDALLEGNSAGA